MVICLCVLAVCVLRLSDFEAERGNRTEVEVNKTQQVLEGVKSLVGELNSARGEFEEAYNFLKDRDKWAKVMKELQRITPDNMWYVVVEGVGDENTENNSDGGPGGGGDDAAAGAGGTVPQNNPFAVESFPITGATGLGGTGDGDGTTAAAGPAARQDLREIKRIRLVGYTLELEQDNQWQLQSELAKNLKDSELFAPEWKITVNRQVGNMSGFEIFLQLKEPIKK